MITTRTSLKEVKRILLSASPKEELRILIAKQQACFVEGGQKGGNYLVEMEENAEEQTDSLAMNHNKTLYVRTLGIFAYFFHTLVFCRCGFTERPTFRFWFPMDDGHVRKTEWCNTLTTAYHQFLVITGREDKLDSRFWVARKFPFKKHQAFIMMHFTPQILDRMLRKQVVDSQDLHVLEYVASHYLGYKNDTVQKILQCAEPTENTETRNYLERLKRNC